MRYLYVLLLCFIIIDVLLTGISGRCRFNLDTPLEGRTPLILINDDVLKPDNRNGDASLTLGTKIQFLCSGRRNYVINHNFGQSSNGTCVNNNQFLMERDNQTYNFDQIKCYQPPKSATKESGTCNGGAKNIHIGFEITPDKFLRKIELCFNEQSLLTYWTKNLLHTSPYSCQVYETTSFKKDYFPRKVDQAYTGSGYDRGHLTAKCDFFTGAEKRMTYYYINSSPQLKVFNEQNWRFLEAEVRTVVARHNKHVYIYTGTYHTIDWLACLVPVQQFFWKVVIESSSGEGVAFVGVNNLQQNISSPCATIRCNILTWLSPPMINRMTHISRGQIYCCSVSSLRSVTNIELPQFSEFRGGILTNL